MSEGKRPGGLTALAVLNFVFGGFSMLGILVMFGIMAVLNAVDGNAEVDEAKREMAKAWELIGIGLFYAMLVIGAVTAILLILSGIGYLKQKKFLGRTLGNVYAILSIGSSAATGVLVSIEAGGGFNIGTILGLVYPLLTLVLLNTTFKEDFVQ